MQWEEAFDRVRDAHTYMEVFGEETGISATQVKSVYRQLAKLLHPDAFEGTDWYESVTGVFARLADLYKEALEMAEKGCYGQAKELAVWQGLNATHSVRQHLGSGDICAIYSAQTYYGGESDGVPSLCKIAKTSADNDLLQTEESALVWLHSAAVPPGVQVFFPALLDTLMYQEVAKPDRRVNILAQLEGFYTLAELKRKFPIGLDPLHMAWIWRRVLWALGHAHQAGIVHGAILPQHVMVFPEQHGVVLVDWCYASMADDSGSFSPIKAIAGDYKERYPREVFAKQAPSPATDIFMAATCMIELMGGDPSTGNFYVGSPVPSAFEAFFKGCLGRSQLTRPQDALQLLDEFDQLLQAMGGPYYPRKFRPLYIP